LSVACLGSGRRRVDLFLDATLSPGSQAPILVDDLRGGELEVGASFTVPTHRCAVAASEPAALPDNPLPARMDFVNALRLDVPLDGGGMGMMMGRGGRMGQGGAGFRGYGLAQQDRIWALASVSSTGHDGPPLFSVARQRTVVLTFLNRTAFPHAMHVHGHHFRQLESGEAWRPYWLDTVIVDPQRTERMPLLSTTPASG
jgi:FtsP/CotA-like multicopper oxidase with cupredoxin domain